MIKHFIILATILSSGLSVLAKEGSLDKKKPALRAAASQNERKSRQLNSEPDIFIGTLKAGGDEECPLLITEGSFQTCARFRFVSDRYQVAISQAISEISEQAKLSGKWGQRETGRGKPAPIFIIDYISAD